MNKECSRFIVPAIRYLYNRTPYKDIKIIHVGRWGCVYAGDGVVFKIQVNIKDSKKAIEEMKLSDYISKLDLSPPLIKGKILEVGGKVGVIYAYKKGGQIAFKNSPQSVILKVQEYILRILYKMIRENIVYLDIKLENFVVYNREIRIIDFDSSYCYGYKLEISQQKTLIMLQIILFALGTYIYHKIKLFKPHIFRYVSSLQSRKLLYTNLFSPRMSYRGSINSDSAKQGILPDDMIGRLRILYSAYVPQFSRQSLFFDTLHKYST